MGKKLVVGGTGFIGSHIVKELLGTDDVRLMVRDIGKAEKIFGKRVEYCRGDIMDTDSVRNAIHGCDTVYYSAGSVSFRKGQEKAVFSINVDGTRNICRAMLDSSADKLVFTSSAATVGKEEFGVSTEKTAFNLWDISSPYKKSKVYAETIVKDNIKQYGLPAVIVNPSIPVGAFDRRLSPSGHLIVNYFSGKFGFYISGGMNFVDVADVAKAHILAEKNGIIGERYIIGGENLTLDSFYRIIKDVSGADKKLIKLPYKAALFVGNVSERIFTSKEPPVSSYTVKLFNTKLYYDVSKAKKELGYKPSGIHDACLRAVNWFKKYGYIK